MSKDPLEPLVDAVYTRVLARVLATLSAEGEYCGTGPLPPDCNGKVRRFNERCRSGVVADATKIGGVWRCSKAAWAASGRRPPRPQAVEQPADDDAQVDAWLAKAGARRTA